MLLTANNAKEVTIFNTRSLITKFTILFTLFTTFTINTLADTISITTNEWFPYTSKNKNGFLDQLLNEIFFEMKVNYELHYNRFEDGYHNTLNNIYNATYPYFKTKTRESEMLFSAPLFQVENVLFYNKDRFKLDTNDIYNHKIGLVKGYAYNNIDVGKFKNPIYFDNELNAYDTLNSGDIDLLPGNKLVGIHLIKSYFNDFYSNIGIIEDKNYISKDYLYFIMSINDKNQKFINAFDTSFDKIKKTGKYKQILLNNSEFINANLSNVIKLVNNTETFPMVTATDTLESTKKYIIPRGTKAIVLEWSKHFKEKGDLKVYDEMFKKTKVRIVNGPLRGKILYVENMYIEID